MFKAGSTPPLLDLSFHRSPAGEHFSVCFLIHRAGWHSGQSKGRNLGIMPLGSSHIKAVSSQNVQERVFLLAARDGLHEAV